MNSFWKVLSRRNWLAAVGVLILLSLLTVLFRRSQSERGFPGWMQRMRAEGERFTVPELMMDRRMDTNDCAEVIESAAARVKALIAKRTNAPSATFTGVSPGCRIVLWTRTNLLGNDGCHLKWGDAEREIALLTNEFQKVHAALRRAPADPGWDYQKLGIGSSLGPPVGSFVNKRVVAQTLGNAMLCELHRTNLVAAQTHLQALVSMTSLDEQGWNVLNQMIRIAITGLAASATWEALQAPGWTDSHLAELQRAWQKFHVVSPMIRTLELERALAIPHFDSFRQARAYPPFSNPTAVTNLFRLAFERYILAPVYKVSWSREDKWFFLRHSQGNLEALRELARHKSWKLAKPSVHQQFLDYTSRVAGLSRYRYPVTHEIMPNLTKGLETMVKNQTLQQLTLVAIAIKRHQLRTGKLPAGLNDLVPDFLPQLPVDYWDGRPIRYRAQPDGAHVLYACGANLRDDGGDPVLDTVWEIPVWPESVPR